jgi:mono/diheme cytochrome c family protein
MRRSATPRTLLVATSSAVLLLGAIAGCIQELDPGAASGAGLSSVDGGDDADNPDAYTTWQLCQSPACDLPSGDIPYLDQTPLIYLPDGATTTDPCDDVEQASMAVRQTYCAQCHQAPGGQGGLGFVLDDGQLTGALSQTATDDAGKPERLVIAGDPLHSLLYARVAQGLSGSTSGMPPLTLAGYTSIPRPTASDLSVLYAWIVACLPGTDGGAYSPGGGDYAPGSSDGGGD